MAPYTIPPAVGVVCRCKAKTGLRRSPRGLHTRTRLSSLLRMNLDLSLKTTWFHSTAVQFPRAQHHSKQNRRWVGVKSSTRNGEMLVIESTWQLIEMCRSRYAVAPPGGEP
ncbi:uncharacterized protein TNCV_4237101 [Trichonephila clavipes]|nr:uncharacterized protein TNCV_4237101 [Trichonephila clavipes]